MAVWSARVPRVALEPWPLADPPWLPQSASEEPLDAFVWAERYWRLGPGRTLERLVAAYAVDPATAREIQDWHGAWAWDERAAHYDADRRAAYQAAAVCDDDEIQRHEALTSTMLQVCQMSAERLLADVLTAPPGRAVNALHLAKLAESTIRLDRLTRGMAERREQVEAATVPLDHLSDEQLDALYAAREALDAARGGGR